MNNFDKNSFPKINKSKNKDGNINDEHNFNISTVQMSITSWHIKHNNDNEPHIVKVFRKNK